VTCYNTQHRLCNTAGRLRSHVRIELGYRPVGVSEKVADHDRVEARYVVLVVGGTAGVSDEHHGHDQAVPVELPSPGFKADRSSGTVDQGSPRGFQHRTDSTPGVPVSVRVAGRRGVIRPDGCQQRSPCQLIAFERQSRSVAGRCDTRVGQGARESPGRRSIEPRRLLTSHMHPVSRNNRPAISSGIRTPCDVNARTIHTTPRAK